jgi:hypothetical protein
VKTTITVELANDSGEYVGKYIILAHKTSLAMFVPEHKLSIRGTYDSATWTNPGEAPRELP